MARRTRRRKATYASSPRVPAEVHGDNEDACCPLCGSDNFDGDLCLICGYQEPPEGMGDIEIDEVDVESSFDRSSQEDAVEPVETGTGTRDLLADEDVTYIENFVSNWLYEAGFTFSAYPEVLDDFIDEAAGIVLENIEAIDCSVIDACELWLLGVERNYETVADVIVDRLNGGSIKVAGRYRKNAASDELVEEMESFGLYSDDGGESYYAPIGDAYGAVYIDRSDDGNWSVSVTGLGGDTDSLESTETYADPFKALQDAAVQMLDDEGEYLEGFDEEDADSLWSLVESGGSGFYEEEVLNENGKFYGESGNDSLSGGSGGTCHGTTQDGEPCQNPVAEGEEYCYLHKSRRKHAGAKFGRGKVGSSANADLFRDKVWDALRNAIGSDIDNAIDDVAGEDAVDMYYEYYWDAPDGGLCVHDWNEEVFFAPSGDLLQGAVDAAVDYILDNVEKAGEEFRRGMEQWADENLS